jgi:mono/diheme cytochrome c family protein
MSPEIVARGKAKYEIFCYPCHGPDLIGNGLVAAKMLVKPPSLLSDKIRGYHDGRIFHIISYGQGVMGSYASQIHDKDDRWAIIKYIRSMQNKN